MDRKASRPGPHSKTMNENSCVVNCGETERPLVLPPEPKQRIAHCSEYKVMRLRECPMPEAMVQCDTPEKAANYWNEHLKDSPQVNPDCECFVVLLLNTRRRIKGHVFVASGTLDTLLVHPREVFRVACMEAAHAVVLMHNHPSGEPEPSEADIKITRDLIRAGQILKIEVLDHIVIGALGRYKSLRELGYFYS